MTDSAATQPHMSDEAIREGSGKTWSEWLDLLDAWGAASKSHTEIARHVADLGVDGWWAQSVTVGYERLKGLRDVGQRRDGRYSGSASKTFASSLADVLAAFTDEAVRANWLAPDTVTLRTAQPEKSARFDSADGIVAAWFTAKGEGKASVQVQIEGLSSREAADAFRATWKAHLSALDAFLKTDTNPS